MTSQVAMLLFFGFAYIFLIQGCGGLIAKCNRCSCPQMPEICYDGERRCFEYKGKTLLVDVNSRVSHYDDRKHCVSLGGELFIPETKEDHEQMKHLLNLLSESYDIDSLAYPLYPDKKKFMRWKDGKQTAFSSGVYYRSPEVKNPNPANTCYNLEDKLYSTGCKTNKSHHLCYLL